MTTRRNARASGDFGADLIITKGGVRTIVQAKRYSKNAGVKAVQEVVAAQKMYNGAYAMVVTNSGYTKQAQRLAQANNVELWDRDRLVGSILLAKEKNGKDKTISSHSHRMNSASGTQNALKRVADK